MTSRQYHQSWRDLHVELEHDDAQENSEISVSICPDCHNVLFHVEGGFLCPICGYSSETLYM